jgi:uncharacterized beta-barrel protein YwiB (DUF1934 family)
MIYSIGEPKKEINLQIKTLVIDSENSNMIAEELDSLLLRALKDELTEDDIKDALGEDAADEIVLCTEGSIETNENGQIEISYCENEDDPQLTALSRIIFSTADPDLVVMTKEGAISAALSFEEGKTHICSYDTPFMPLKVYVTSKTVCNRLLTDGYLKLDYILGLNDTPPQHFIITVTAKVAPEDILSEFFNK